MKRFLLILILSVCFSSVRATIWMPSIFSDNMVLQQKSEVMLWGWSTGASEELVIEVSWMDQPLKTRAFQGNWSVMIPTPEAGGPFTITVSGHEKIVLENVLIGEVWLLSGQSNMEWPARAGIEGGEEAITGADHPNLRFFQVPRHRAEHPQQDTYGQWEVSTPETMQRFSAVGYFFARNLQEHMDVPVGLIGSYWGGSSVEVWMPKDLIEGSPELREQVGKMSEPPCCPQKTVGELYNAMIHPLKNYPIAGTLWYQGESNRQNAFSYYITFPLMIETWREKWGSSFPFYFVQLAPFRYSRQDSLAAAVVRDAQLSTLRNVSNTGMVVTNDIGNLTDIHPRNKKEVGRRLALWALAKSYGVKDLEYSGPLYRDMEVNKDRVTLHFDHVGDGLVARGGGELTGFYVAGSDQKFHPARAKIKGSTIEVRSKEVKDPVAVRFAFFDTALHNLFNSAGLPASPFRTDDWDIALPNQ